MEKFRVVVKALITYNRKVLIGKKEEDEDHPIGGEWHILGGHLEHGEKLEEAVKREVKEETGLEVNVHQIVDTMTFSWEKDEKDSLQVVFHVEADNGDAEAEDDLEEVKWVKPEELEDELDGEDADRIKERDSQAKFIEKLEKIPAF